MMSSGKELKKVNRGSDFRIGIFIGAKNGHLNILKNLLKDKSPQEKKNVVDSNCHFTTPLIISCCYGHLNVVKFLVHQCKADIEKVGIAILDKKLIDNAPPLWCAARAGHLNVVKFLCEANAFVNSVTITNSTPLQTACFYGRLEIVKYLIERGADIEKPDCEGHTCLMSSCYKGHLEICEYLLRHKADVNRKKLNGDTALHECIKGGNLEIFKMLQEYGVKMHENSSGLMPIILAAKFGSSSIVEYIIETFSKKKCFHNGNCEIRYQIDALKLLGATFITKFKDLPNAYEYFKRAMHLRHTESFFIKLDVNDSLSTLINAMEFDTFEQLEDLAWNTEVMNKQALLIKSRILGNNHPHITDCLFSLGHIYCRAKDFDNCIQLWMYALDIALQKPLNTDTQKIFNSFIDLFCFIIFKASTESSEIGATYYRCALNVFHKTITETSYLMSHPRDCMEEQKFYYNVRTALHLIQLLCMLKPNSQFDEFEFKSAVYNLVKMNPKCYNGWTLLYMACCENRILVSKHSCSVLAYPPINTVELLIELGAPVNAVNDDKNTPLHIAAKNRPFSLRLFHVLLESGAHFDFRNSHNQTAFQLLKPTDALNIHLLHYQNLQCLCSHVILENRIPYHGRVPEELETFLNNH